MTGQFADKLRYQGIDWQLLSLPLEDYFENFPRHRIKSDAICTGCYRGYVASWMIEGKKLKIINVEILQYSEYYSPSGFRSIAPDGVIRGASPRPHARWFTGYLVMGAGEIKHYRHAGFARDYERHMVLGVIKGNVSFAVPLTNDVHARLRRDWQSRHEWLDLLYRNPESARVIKRYQAMRSWSDILPVHRGVTGLANPPRKVSARRPKVFPRPLTLS